MRPRSWRLRAPAVGLVLVALALAACGGGRAAPADPSATLQPSPVIAATSTPRVAPLSPTPVATAPSSASPPSASNCPDPYPNGAPYTPAPGSAIHLQPIGTPPPLARYEQPPLVIDGPLGWIIGSVLGGDIGHFSIVVKRLDNHQGFVYNGGRVFYAASLYKVWAMLEAYHQRATGLLDFDEQYIVSDYYSGLSLNEGELPPCSQVTLSQALHAMMSVSDNVAGNIVLERDGVRNVSAALRTLGLTNTNFASNGDVLTTADDMALLLESIARRQAVSSEASDEMLLLLGSELIDDRLPSLLPAGTVVAHKTGNWSDATHDAGIVYSPRATYVIAVLTDYSYDDDGSALIARLSRAVYDYYNPG